MCAFNKVLAHIVAMCDTNMPFIGLRIEVGIKKYFVSFFPSPTPDSGVWMWLFGKLVVVCSLWSCPASWAWVTQSSTLCCSGLVRAASLNTKHCKKLEKLREKGKWGWKMHLWEGLGDNCIPDLHRPFFGFPVLEDMKHLSPAGEKKNPWKC